MKKNIVLVTGMSGAGKTSAMNALEDLNYYTIDNFPKELLDQLEDLLCRDDPKYDNLALAVSAQDYQEFVNFFDAMDRPVQIVFVDAKDDELLLRYRFTRRKHPLITMGQANTLEEAIELERDYFESLRDNMQDVVQFDTTKMTQQELSNTVRSHFSGSENKEFAITFQSFGFKKGVPLDADEIIDVRFLPNPFYDPDLRTMTGNDKPVYDYVMEKEETKEFCKTLKSYLDFVLKAYQDQQKNYLIVSVGCTGGQHRSVSIANWLKQQYEKDYKCYVNHRDIRRDH